MSSVGKAQPGLPRNTGLMRREVLLALGLAACLPGALHAQPSEIDARSPDARRIHEWTSQATALLRQGQVMEALALLTRADQLIEDNAAARWPWRMRTGPNLGFSLLAIGRGSDAMPVLMQSLDAQARVQSLKLMPFLQVVERHDSAMGRELIGTEFRRQFFSAVVVDGEGPHSLDELVLDVGIGSSELLFNLGRALLAGGHAAKLEDVYLEHVANAPAPPLEDGFSRYAVEHRHFKFAVLLAQAGKAQSADRAFRQALRWNGTRLQQTASLVASPSAQLGAFGVGRRMLSIWVGHVLRSSVSQGVSQTQQEELLAKVLQLKGLGVRYAEKLNTLLQTSTERGTQAVAEKLLEIEDRMAQLPVSQAGLQDLLALELQRSQLLTLVLPELATRGMGDVVMPESDLLNKVRDALGSDVAIGFFAYTPLGPEGLNPAPQRYLRYCVARGRIELRDTGPMAAIDNGVFAFRRALLAGGKGEAQGSALFAQLLHDMPEEVANAERWVIDPDGALSLLPFEALPDKGKLPLLLRHQIRYTTSLAQLATVQAQPPSPATGTACVVANPAYPAQVSRDAGSAPGLRLTELALRNGAVAVPPLPDTADEAHTVAQELAGAGWRVQRLEAEAASAESLLAMRSAPSVLHIASHAVLLDSGLSVEGAAAAEAAHPYAGDNILDMVLPGRRSALVLAGKQAPSVLLAKDFCRLPLQGTHLAVLSACDTGNGDVELGEGISGLRRALEQAGVASSVTSLWPVPSRATAALMASFYQLLAKGMGKSQALQQAKVALMRSGAPPHAWAGFLLGGADVPLINRAHDIQCSGLKCDAHQPKNNMYLCV
jgi:CHAT domain-containing protein